MTQLNVLPNHSVLRARSVHCIHHRFHVAYCASINGVRLVCDSLGNVRIAVPGEVH